MQSVEKARSDESAPPSRKMMPRSGHGKASSLLRVAGVMAAILACLTLFDAAAAFAQDDPIADVAPFLGADWWNRVFVGASVPFGTVKVGPDMESFDGKPSGNGYLSSGRILGFSHLHVSGTSGKYGNILVAPVSGPLIPSDIKSGRSRETAAVGYYATRLTRYATDVELTSSRRVAFHRYRFLQGGDSHITLNLDHCLNKGPGDESQKFLGGDITVLSDHEVEGVGRYTGGWNEGGEYRVYFHLVTDVPARSASTWMGANVTSSAKAHADSDQPIGVSLNYDVAAGQTVQVKIGISFISAEQARKNIEEESPGWDFDALRERSVELWRERLSKIVISGADRATRRQFYTALYHSMLMPSDRQGENPKWTSSEPYYDDYYTLWDTFRTVGPLLTLIAPERQRDIVRSLVDIYRHEGYLPDARSGNDTGRTQGGSNADLVIADAFLKGITGIDYKTAFQGMLKDADVPPADPRKEGRGGLKDYIAKGYVTLADERAGTRTVEYSYDDFAIGEVACRLGKPEEAQRFATRSRHWENLWDASLSVEGVSGFLRPRTAEGGWAAPYLVKRGTWPDFFYEDDLWTYSLYVPHDVRRLIELSGGNEAFVRRLDVVFDRLHFDMTNEPGFLIPTLYIWAGRPDKTADRVVEYLEKWFADSRGALPGNDDSGAMSSWFVFHSLGIYPNAGQDVYLIGTPSFPEADIALPSGKTLRIVAENLDGDHLNRYVQSATLNGAPLDRAWFRHAEIKDGGTLLLRMGSEPTAWGTTSPPPSLSDPQSSLCNNGENK